METKTLADRGIDSVATANGWQPHEVRGAHGWAYPVYNADGLPYKERRWKAANGHKPKYLWLWEKPQKAKYYFLPGTFAEIVNQHGQCWLAGGEPDVLALNAAGHKNTICWLEPWLKTWRIWVLCCCITRRTGTTPEW
jgi:hypothetical protein